MSKIIDSDFYLFDVLKQGDEKDLSIIADVITDKNKGRLTLSSSVQAQIEMAKRGKTLKRDCDLLAKEIQSFGGNSIMTFFRGEGVAYGEIVSDVASHMKVEADKFDTIEELEVKIMLKVLSTSFEQMTPEEQRAVINEVSGGKVQGVGAAAIGAIQAAILANGFAPYKLAAVIANSVAWKLLGRGLSFGASAGLMRGIGAFAGPIGWAITAIWTAFDMASPAYRITVPCVIQVAYMRQKTKSA